MAKKKATKQKKTGKKSSISDLPGLLVSDRVQLEDVRLIECQCSQQPCLTKGKKAFNIEHSAQAQIDSVGGYLLVIAKFLFEGFTEGQMDKPVVKIEASFLLTYKLDNFEGLTKAGFKQFADMNGVYNAWPYWREFVQNTIARMNLPTLTIPVFRIVEPPKDNKAAKKTSKKKVKKKAFPKKSSM